MARARAAATRTRIIAIAGAAAFCVGLGTPALAAAPAAATQPQHTQGVTRVRVFSLVQQKAFAESLLGREATWLSALKAKVAADPQLSAAQRTAFASKVGAALAAIQAAQAKVGAATDSAQIFEAFRAAQTAIPAYPRPNRPTLTQAKAAAIQLLDRKAGWLTALKAKVAADPRLSAAQQSAFTAKIDAALAAIAKAKAAVQAATSYAQLRAALGRGWFDVGRYPRPIARQHESGSGVTLTSARTHTKARPRLISVRTRSGRWDRRDPGMFGGRQHRDPRWGQHGGWGGHYGGGWGGHRN